MFAIIGIVIVFGAVIGGFLMANGQLAILWQPNELIVIVGAALGATLIGNPPSVLMGALKGIVVVFTGSRFKKAFYLANLKMLMDVFNHARKNGLVSLEQDVEDPGKSQLFAKHPMFQKDHHAVHFFCDTLRTSITGGVDYFTLDQMMEADLDVHHHQSGMPAAALNTTADALPGMGIVAAVLGVVITMGSLGGPPEEIGHHVAAALVGTFLGILLCYGLVGPIAANMQKVVDQEAQYYQMLRVGLASFARGLPPILAVEFARRVIPAEVRPSFKEMEEACSK